MWMIAGPIKPDFGADKSDATNGVAKSDNVRAINNIVLMFYIKSF